MLAIGLVCEACPDGVEQIEEGGAKVYRHRSEARFPVNLTNDDNLENPVVLSFLNATDDASKIAFMNTFGLVWSARGDKHASEWDLSAACEDVEDIRQAMLSTAKISGEVSAAAAMERANAVLYFAKLTPQLEAFGPNNSPEIRLMANSITDYMKMELAIVLRNGAKMRPCENCSRLFFYGTGTGRRSTAEYCRDLCRVQASRRKKAAEKAA